MKRGESGLSLVVGVNKPSGMSSHDVVNACRRIFGERRVGHMGTLDPLATGVLPICIGPATRLNSYLSEHDKHYRVTMVFGSETDTDDSEGKVIRTAPVYEDLLDGEFAENYIRGLVGSHMQIPPAYSAIKKDGAKAYEKARSGEKVVLEPRAIEVYNAKLVDRFVDPETDELYWKIDFHVSKGTYIRALVRDIGRELGSLAHMTALKRTKMGSLELDRCVSLETLEKVGLRAAIDPLRLLDMRFTFGDDFASAVENGNKLQFRDVDLFEITEDTIILGNICCTATTSLSLKAPKDQEIIGVVIENRLKALYIYDEATREYRSKCVFAEPIMRTYY